MDTIELLVNSCKEFEVKVDEKRVEKFLKYKDLLIKWNEVMNLTAVTDENEIILKHFVDSITPLKYIDFQSTKIIDVGTGAGFPGLPLKIIEDTIDLTLLDSLKKRTNFLNEVVNNLDLENVNIIHGRAEVYGVDEEYREQFDVTVSRAVAKLCVLCEYCLPFVKVGGYFISLKGPDVKEEVNEAKKSMDVLGGKLEDIKDVKLPNSDITHSLVFIKKVRPTPSKYPRKAGKPTKQPII